MKQWQELGKELRRYINPETFPVAIKILKDKGEIPSGTRTPVKDLKIKMAHCQAQAICRKYGWTIAMTKEDLGCAISGHTYGWEPVNQEDALNFFIRMNYAADTTVALNIFQSFRTLKPNQCEAVVYSPLEWTKIEPDVILIYLNPAQLMRCFHGSTQRTGQPALPASHLKDLVEGLAKTHERGIRYPIPSFLRYQPEVGLTLPLTDIFKQVGEKIKR